MKFIREKLLEKIQRDINESLESSKGVIKEVLLNRREWEQLRSEIHFRGEYLRLAARPRMNVSAYCCQDRVCKVEMHEVTVRLDRGACC